MNIEINKLLQPIDEISPVGANLQNDPSMSELYYQLRDLRSAARLSERKRMQEDESEIIQAHEWKDLMTLCCMVLEKKSKNIEVACWLCEGLVRSNGFSGLRLGFKIVEELINRFWPEVYPLEDEDGIAAKLVTLSGLNGQDEVGTLIVPIQSVPLMQGDIPFGYWQCQQAQEIAQIPNLEKREARIEAGGVSIKEIEQTVAQTSSAFFNSQHEALLACEVAFNSLCQTIDEKCAEIEIPTSQIKKALKNCETALESFISKKQALITADEMNSSTELNESDNENQQQIDNRSWAEHRIAERNKVLTQLTEIAHYFREVEPHSPISYVLERTVRWGNMTLEELSQEVFLDSNMQFAYCKMVGINLPQSDNYAMEEGMGRGMERGL